MQENLVTQPIFYRLHLRRDAQRLSLIHIRLASHFRRDGSTHR